VIQAFNNLIDMSNRLRKILSIVPVPIIELDNDYCVKFINDTGLDLIKNQIAISQNYASLEPDDLYIFFHIAAVTLDEEDEPIFSPTETVGPFRIDIVSTQKCMGQWA
jgi:hypothetical protein